MASAVYRRCLCGNTTYSSKRPTRMYSVSLQVTQLGVVPRLRSRGYTICLCGECAAKIGHAPARKTRRGILLAVRAAALSLVPADKPECKGKAA